MQVAEDTVGHLIWSADESSLSQPENSLALTATFLLRSMLTLPEDAVRRVSMLSNNTVAVNASETLG